MASIPRDQEWIWAAVSSADITFIRLTATRRTRLERLRTRETGTGFAHQLRASDDLSAFILAHDPTKMPSIATDGRSVTDVAEEVLRLSRWW